MKVLDEDQFSFNEREPVSAITFETFFQRKWESVPIVLVFDEVSALTEKSLRTLWVCHYQFCLHAFAVIGVETINMLLTSQPNSKIKSNISPFTVEVTVELVLDHFVEADIKMLLDDYAGESSIELESADIAKDIFEHTLGHKGLAAPYLKQCVLLL